MYKTLIIVLFLLCFSKTSFAQNSIEIKGGLTYLLNKEYYTSNNGLNLSVSYYPLTYKRFELGLGIGYNSKGKFYNYLPYEYSSPRSESPVEFLELCLPSKTYFNLTKGVDVYLLLSGKYNIILTTYDRFFRSVAESRTFNSTLGISAGLGFQYTKIYPNLLFELSINPDLTYMAEENIRNTTLELKTGILFNGFKSFD
ncbi:MAG TPA: hypothetical protein VK004_03260 [Ignavibacteria bacterium]|nr:hypothetical protein [Ignavibacteria bacterium]